MTQNNISLCMIVKNEAKYLRACLESVQGLVDEIVIVDTGSSDETVNIAKEFNSQIYHYDWSDNFSAARNFSLSKATKSWILVLDADERLHQDDHGKIRELISKHADIDAFYLDQISYTKDTDALKWEPVQQKLIDYPYTGFIREPIIRLFKNSSELRYQGIIHEHVELKEQHQSLNSAIPIHHLGKIVDHTRKDKLLLYQKLTQEKYRTNPNNNHVIYEYAVQCYVTARWDESIVLAKQLINNDHYRSRALIVLTFSYFKKNEFIKVKEYLLELMKSDPENPQIYIIMPYLMARLNQFDLMYEYIAIGKLVMQQYPSFYFNASIALRYANDNINAIEMLLNALPLIQDGQDIDQHAQTLRKLSELYWLTDNHDKALNYINQACELLPNDSDNLYQKSVILYQLGESQKAKEFINKIKAQNEDKEKQNKINHMINLLNQNNASFNMKGDKHVLF